MQTITKFFTCVVAAAALVSVGLNNGCTASMYSEEQHIQRIRERAEERFLGEESEYTGLEVYPVYNEQDELKYALIELESQGFTYVYISDSETPWSSMYSTSSHGSESWMPYRVKDGLVENIEDAEGNLITQAINRAYYRDENGDVIIYHQSHFKAAGIENERRYLLLIEPTVDLGYTSGLIPAVKRGEQYLDLVDGTLIDYTPGMSAPYAIADIAFINNSGFDL